MTTWREKFNQLSTTQQKALDEVKRVNTTSEWSNAMKKVKTSMNDINNYFKRYESQGSPDHNEEMPNW